MACKPLRIHHRALVTSHHWWQLLLLVVRWLLVAGPGWRGLRPLQCGDHVVKICHAALQIGAPREQLADPGCSSLLGLVVGVRGASILASSLVRKAETLGSMASNSERAL